MFASVRKALSCVKKNPGDDASSDSDEGSAVRDDLLWSRDLERHAYGDFSLAVAQANAVLEDQSQVEALKDFTFVGVYDGHGGPDASRHLCTTLFHHLVRLYEEQGGISVEIIRNAIAEIERWFINRVRVDRDREPEKAGMGSCCLIGVIYRGTLYVANMGDSRAVMGTSERPNKIRAEQLTREHNVNFEAIRREVRALHPEDPNIVVKRQGMWRIKGIIQVSRSIGDAYLKYPELALGPAYPRFHPPEPITRPVLTAEPEVYFRALRPTDRFLIFASDGLWEHISNQAAVETVQRHPHAGIARRLVLKAMKAAARKSKVSYTELKGKAKGNRRNYHDDITVAVIFIQHEMLGGTSSVPVLSVRGFPAEAGLSSSGTNRAGPSCSSTDQAGPSGSGGIQQEG